MPFGCSRLIVTRWISLLPRVRLASFKHSASSQALLLVGFRCSFLFCFMAEVLAAVTPMPTLAQGAYIQGPGFGVEVGRPGYRERYEDRYEDRGYRGYGYDRDRYRGHCRTVTIERDDGSVRRIRRCD